MEPKNELPPVDYTPAEQAELEKSRTISDANLLIRGSEYRINEQGDKELDTVNMPEKYLEYEKILKEAKNLSREENIGRIERLFSLAINVQKGRNNYHENQNRFAVSYYDENGLFQREAYKCRDNGVKEDDYKYGHEQSLKDRNRTAILTSGGSVSFSSIVDIEDANLGPI